ncbi:hypothetical protein D9758_004183 [Tetrapyrgos nigripes]|uniref:Uncharacterized protein n=1 Tax=Tetrapyrgos nigripes TaxID=182062 RepID=A0A8H5GUU5_9AGAR|nr:hypothetical protein D9758_004183 [Tetrapyrgos nigripes]
MSTATDTNGTSSSDPLQVAAQLYPWMYMTSTLEACFKTAEETANKELDERAKSLEAGEADVSDQQVRMEAERTIEFYDELSSDKFATVAPKIMQSFLSHGDACTKLESEALQLASKDLSHINLDDYENHPMQPYNDMLEQLGKSPSFMSSCPESLLGQASELETTILDLTTTTTGNSSESHEAQVFSESNQNLDSGPKSEQNQMPNPESGSTQGEDQSTSVSPQNPESQSESTSPSSSHTTNTTAAKPSNSESTAATPSESLAMAESESTAARSQLIPVFTTCLPILRARKANIAMAQQLVEGAKEMLGMTLHLESLGFEDGDDADKSEVDEDEDERRGDGEHVVVNGNELVVGDGYRQSRPGGNSSDEEDDK